MQRVNICKVGGESPQQHVAARNSTTTAAGIQTPVTSTAHELLISVARHSSCTTRMNVCHVVAGLFVQRYILLIPTLQVHILQQMPVFVRTIVMLTYASKYLCCPRWLTGPSTNTCRNRLQRQLCPMHAHTRVLVERLLLPKHLGVALHCDTRLTLFVQCCVPVSCIAYIAHPQPSVVSCSCLACAAHTSYLTNGVDQNSCNTLICLLPAVCFSSSIKAVLSSASCALLSISGSDKCALQMLLGDLQ